ncbi:alpha/beta-hydrolase [Trametes polyzona]|nr:alpha/beta-hydrolase [Trametes polyzona]
MSDSLEKPFTVAVSDAELELLHKKLELVRFPDELDGAGWNYGSPLADIKRLVAHWKDKFDWRKAEAEINKFPMFTRDIDVDGFGTLNIHYVHQRSEVKNAIPLLFVHGWPGFFLEARKLLPILTAKSADYPSFHVVAISLPGYGFSEAPKKPGFSAPQFAEVFNKLMLSLGYKEYTYQGGDWGHALGLTAVANYGHKHIKAWHTNVPFAGPPKFFSNPLLYLGMFLLPLDSDAKARFKRTSEWLTKGTGYQAEQGTKPQTIGYSLADSPVGLLAWIYEKLVNWSDEYPWTDDEVIEWISVYWFSRAGPAATLRIYYEMSGGVVTPSFGTLPKMTVPVGASYFPREILQTPKSWSHLLGKLVFEAEHDKGGHFAAFEQPEKLAGDLRKMYAKGGPAYGVVPGRTGYD